MANLDWLHYAVSSIKLFCVRKEKPRQWRLSVPFQFVGHDDQPLLCNLGYDVQESESENDSIRHNDTTARLHKATVKMHTEVQAMATSDTFFGKPFQIILPVGMAFIAKRAAKRRQQRKYGKEFLKHFDIKAAPEPGIPHRFALIHRVTGRMTFFILPGPVETVSRAEIYQIASDAIDQMLDPPGVEKARDN